MPSCGPAGRMCRLLAWKLRTMVDGADHNKVRWTTDNGSRITRVCRFVRKTRLDWERMMAA